MFQLGSGIVGSELPVNALLGGVSGRSPGNKQTAESRQVGDSVVRNTLTPKSREFNFRNVKPASMFLVCNGFPNVRRTVLHAEEGMWHIEKRPCAY